MQMSSTIYRRHVYAPDSTPFYSPSVVYLMRKKKMTGRVECIFPFFFALLKRRRRLAFQLPI